MDQWAVLIPEHHPGFIDWATFQANQARLAANTTSTSVRWCGERGRGLIARHRHLRPLRPSPAHPLSWPELDSTPSYHCNRDRPAESKPGAISSEIMTLYQVTRYLNCHRSTVYRLVHQGELPAFRVGNDHRFLRADIMKWIAQRHVQMAPIKPSRPARYKRKS